MNMKKGSPESENRATMPFDLKSIDLHGISQDIYSAITSNGKLKAVILTFVLGMLAHMFGLVNIMHNHDDIGGFLMGNGAGVSSGRWGLSILGKFVWEKWGPYNTAYLLGAVLIICLSLSAWFIMDMFKVKSWKLGLMLGMAMVVFPSTVSIMFYRFTASYYGLSILLAVMAVWFVDKFKFGAIASILCIACSLGLYQAFMPFTISLMVVLLIYKVLKEDYSFLDCLKTGIYYCIILAAGLALYFVILKYSLKVFNESLNEYQGISNMGRMSATTLYNSIYNAYVYFFLMPFYGYCDIAGNNLLKISYQLLIGASVIMIAYAAIRKRNIGKIIMVALLVAVLPLAIDFIRVMTPTGDVYTLMLFSFVTLLIIPIVIYDCIDKEWKFVNILRKAVLVIMFVMLCNYTYIGNVNYMTMYYTTRQMENYMTSMLTQVRMTDGYRIYMPWAFIGDEINDPTFYNPTGNNLLYGGNWITYYNTYTRNTWLQAYAGFNIPCADDNTRAMLAQDERVKEMPCYPDNGSIKVIDGVVVIKLQP